MSIAVAARRLSLLVAVLVLALPSVALASGQDVIDDCLDDQVLSEKHSQADYKQALSGLPTDSDAYSDCRDQIKRARIAQARRRGDPGSPGGGSGPAAPRKIPKDKREKIRKTLGSGDLVNAAPLKIGDAVVQPGSLRSSAAIPAPLIAVLVLTLLGVATATAIAIRRFVLDRRDG